jgi:hypothetical protein
MRITMRINVIKVIRVIKVRREMISKMVKPKRIKKTMKWMNNAEKIKITTKGPITK